MEEVEKTTYKTSKIYKIFIKYLPYIIVGIVVTVIGLSFVGGYFEVRVKVDGEKIDTVYRLSDLLFNNPVGLSLEIYYVFLYLIIPFVGCTCLLLGKIHQNFKVVAILMFLFAAIAMILVKDSFATILSETQGANYSIHDTYVCYILPIVGLFIASFFALIIGFDQIDFGVRDITEIGVLIGLALVLNFIKIVQLGATGGSVNFQILPLFILALRRGPLKGFVGAGIVYGLISCLLDGYGIYTFPFDYLLGMGSTCIIGFFSPLIFGENQKAYNLKGELFIFIGGSIATFFRFVGGCASSMIIYGLDLHAAMLYNVLYVFISGAIAIVVVMAIYGPIIKINKRYPAISNFNNTVGE